jgi:hypothetical protein
VTFHSCRRNNTKLRIETDKFELQLNDNKIAKEKADKYIEVLEQENEGFKFQLEKIRRILPPKRLELVEKQSPFAIIK